MSTQKMGHARNPKSAAAHSTALSQVSSLSAFALVGRTQTPETRPVVMCAYQVANIDPCCRLARTRHQSRHRAMFFHCLAGGWATNRPCSSGRSEGETRAKASATTSMAVSAERSPPAAGVQRLRCECSPGPVHRDARRCGADARSDSRHSWPDGSRWACGPRPPRSSTHLVVQLRSDRVPSFACAHLCADMVPKTAGVRQYLGHVCAHGGGQVAFCCGSLRKRRGGPRAPPSRRPQRNLVCSRYNRGCSREPTAAVRRLARRLAAHP